MELKDKPNVDLQNIWTAAEVGQMVNRHASRVNARSDELDLIEGVDKRKVGTVTIYNRKAVQGFIKLFKE